MFREGRVVALIDFAMASPGRPLWDLAIAGEIWGPLGDPARRDPQGRSTSTASLASGSSPAATGSTPIEAEALVDVLAEERAHSAANIRAEIADGNPVVDT